MNSLRLNAHALSGAVSIALLASCGGGGESATPLADQAARPLTQSRTFNYTGAKQSFTVPAGVTRITVVARGAGGDSCVRTGRGARVYAVIPVTPKERLTVYVGGGGAGLGGAGGFNGGGASYSGYGGAGGASDVRVRPGGLRDRIVVAAGGGSAGLTYFSCSYGVLYGSGGGGGGLTGENGQLGWGDTFGAGGGGSGGTQTQGGAGGKGGSGYASSCPYGAGKPGADGALGVGGAGAKKAKYHRYYALGGGGGGGGYFGGGGGGGSCLSKRYVGGGGGGGGSSYAEPRATNVHYWPNWKNASGDGLVVLSW